MRKRSPFARRLRGELLEDRRLLAVVYEPTFMDVTFELVSGTFSGTDFFDPVPDSITGHDPFDYHATFNGNFEVLDFTIDYDSPTHGTGTASGSGTGTGMETNGANPPSQIRLEITGNGTVTDNDGDVSRSVAQVNTISYTNRFPGGKPINRDYGQIGDGTVDISTLPFTFTHHSSNPYVEPYGHGVTVVDVDATFQPVSDEEYDIAVSGNWTDTGLTYTLDIVGPAQPSPSHSTPIAAVQLFWATGPTIDDIIGLIESEDAQPIYWNMSRTVANVTDLPEPPANAAYLLVVADRSNTVVETEDILNNVLALKLIDVVMHPIVWTAGDTVQFSYEVRLASLDAPVNIEVWFASEEGFPYSLVYSEMSETEQGVYGPITVPRGDLLYPGGATHVMAVADLNDDVKETRENNNARLVAIPDLAIDLLAWRNDFDGLDLGWSISGHKLPRGTEVRLYWSFDETASGITGGPLFTEVLPAGTIGSKQVHLPTEELGTPPEGANYLVAIADPIEDEPPVGLIIEVSEDNNVASLLPDIRVTEFDYTAAGDGLQVKYDVFGLIPAGTTLNWYWATGADFGARIEPPAFASLVETLPGRYGPVSVSFAGLGPPPGGATHVVAAADLSEEFPSGVVIEQVEANNERAFPLPDLTVSSAGWNNGDGGLDFQYTIAKNELGKAAMVSVYWASGDAFDDRIGEAIQVFLTGTHQGPSAILHVAAALFAAPPAGADRVLIVADPLDGVAFPGEIVEADESNNLRALKPDLVLRTPTWIGVGTVVGIDFQYFVGGFLIADTPVGAWWATGTSFGSRIGDALVLITAETTAGVHDAPDVTLAQINSRPLEAKHLVVAGDLPDNLVDEAAEANNENSLALPDLVPSSGEWLWDGSQLSLKFVYQVAFGDAPVASLIQFYWATGTTLDTVIAGAGSQLASTAASTVGTHEFTLGVAVPPEGAAYLLAQLDSTNSVPETNELNNIFVLANNRAPIINEEPVVLPPVEEDEVVPPTSTVALDPPADDPDEVIWPDDPIVVPETGIVVTDDGTDPDGTGTVALPQVGRRQSAGDPIVWEPLGAVSPTHARLLSPDMFLRFVPQPGFVGRVPNAITFRAWDQTTGTAGGFADTTQNGNATAFSTGTRSLPLDVLPKSLVVTVSNQSLRYESGSHPISVATDRDGLGLTYQYEFDLDNDGSYDDLTNHTGEASLSVYDQGAYPVRVRVSTARGIEAFGSTVVVADNQSPGVYVNGPLFGGYVAQSTPFTLTTTDGYTDTAAGFRYAIDWDGDGNVDETIDGDPGEFNPFHSFDVAHTFAQTGTFDVTVTATDKDGGTSEPSVFSITIVAPPSLPVGDIIDVAPDPRDVAVSEIRLEFDQWVGGFDVASFTLIRDGQLVDLTGATLFLSDPQTYVLRGLESVTALPGSYALRLAAQFIGNFAGQHPAADLLESWVNNGGSTNHAPTAIALSSLSIPENSPADTVVAVLTTTDADAGDTFNYELLPGADNGFFAVVGNKLRAGAMLLNHEGRATRSIALRSTDQGGLSWDQSFTIQVLDVNEPPTLLALSRSKVFADIAGAWVAAVSLFDPDLGDTQSFVLSDSHFRISGGNLYLAADQSLDISLQPVVDLEITAHDGGNLATSTVFHLVVEAAPLTWEFAYQWKPQPFDVNLDGFVTPLDALLIINHLNAGGRQTFTPLPGGTSAGPFYDVSGDNHIAPLDALLVINYLNAGGTGEGESAPAGDEDDVWRTTDEQYLWWLLIGQLWEDDEADEAVLSRL